MGSELERNRRRGKVWKGWKGFYWEKGEGRKPSRWPLLNTLLLPGPLVGEGVSCCPAALFALVELGGHSRRDIPHRRSTCTKQLSSTIWMFQEPHPFSHVGSCQNNAGGLEWRHHLWLWSATKVSGLTKRGTGIYTNPFAIGTMKTVSRQARLLLLLSAVVILRLKVKYDGK